MEGNRGNRCTNLAHRSTNVEFLIGGVIKKAIMRKKSAQAYQKQRIRLMKKLQKSLGYADQKLFASRQFVEGSNKYEEFFCYNENESEEESEDRGDEESTSSDSCTESECGGEPNKSTKSGNKPSLVVQDMSINLTDFLLERQLGNIRVPLNLHSRVSETAFQAQPDFALKHLLTNGILQEKPVRVENLNKVFCSQWLSDRQVIFGTKCNKLMVLDVNSKHMTQIPSLPSSARSLPPDQACGIHAIQINPSRTMLATGGKNVNDLAVYKLPTFDPVCVGEMAHNDWLFALAWLDDEFVVSGSRDTSIALWRIPETDDDPAPTPSSYRRDSNYVNSVATSASSVLIGPSLDELAVPSLSHIRAVSVKTCKSAQKVRDIVFNRRLQEVACVSLNGYIHVWSADKFVQKFSRKLPFSLENVCCAVHEDYGLYAVGSKSHTTLMDARTIQCVKKIPSKYSGFGIRSTSFYSSLLSIGTGQGTLLIYDLRAGKYLESNTNSARSAILKPSSGWTYPDEEVLMDVYRQKYVPAVYTHSVDASGTRIFAAGGPLPINLCGNYLGLWH